MNGASISKAEWITRLAFGSNPKRTVIRIISLVVVCLVVFRVVLIPMRVSGLSMYPTYRDGRVNVINHQAYRWKKPKRGDVIAFRLPEEGDVVLLKRVIGLPGERVLVVDGRAYIDGKLLDEPYIKTSKDAPSTGREIKLGKDEYYVMGDNRNISILRRIPEHYIIGKVLF